MAQYADDRFHSLMLGGAVLPWERNPDLPKQTVDLFQFTGGAEAYIGAIEAIAGQPLTPEWDAYMRDNDLHALAAMLSPEDSILSHGFQDVAPYLTLPSLFFVGEKEEDLTVRECVQRMPNATYVCFPGLGHLDCWSRSDLVLPHIRRFLAEVGEG